MNIFDELAKPFPENEIMWRIGATNAKKNGGKATKGIPLAYIDARAVEDRLDFVLGPENWQCRYPYKGCCEIGIRINGEWIWKANGAGETKMEAEKGQYSDAFKRAAVMHGIGRYLYNLPNEWVDLDNYGKPKQSPKLPTWAIPSGWKRIPVNIKNRVYETTIESLANDDGPGLMEIWDEFDADEQAQLWSLFDSKQRSAIKSLLDVTRGKAA